jgi:hypothetical protein
VVITSEIFTVLSAIGASDGCKIMFLILSQLSKIVTHFSFKK